MPVSKKTSNQKTTDSKVTSTTTTTSTAPVNIAEVGRKYYDILDVFSSKVVSKIVENSGQLNIDKKTITELNKIISEEAAMAKDWGIDQIIKVIKK